MFFFLFPNNHLLVLRVCVCVCVCVCSAWGRHNPGRWFIRVANFVGDGIRGSIIPRCFVAVAHSLPHQHLNNLIVYVYIYIFLTFRLFHFPARMVLPLSAPVHSGLDCNLTCHLRSLWWLTQRHFEWLDRLETQFSRSLKREISN